MRISSTAVAVGVVGLAMAAFANGAGAGAPVGNCGDPNSDNLVTASDALHVLQAAVGLGTCDLHACDADGSGEITAKDALVVLKYAVANPVSLNCPTTTSSTIHEDECFDDSDCDPKYGQAGPHCCGYHCCECDSDDSQCGEGERCEGEVCVPNP